MAWIGAIAAASAVAATNQKDGKRRRRRKESNLALIFSILLIIIGSMIPLGFIFLSENSGGSFPVFIIGIVFLIIFGSSILIFAVMETAYDEEKDPELSRREFRRESRRDLRSDKNSEDTYYWGNPESDINQRSIKNYCSQCGSQVEYEDQFCATCGRRIN
jgi:hypothetical protein